MQITASAWGLVTHPHQSLFSEVHWLGCLVIGRYLLRTLEMFKVTFRSFFISVSFQEKKDIFKNVVSYRCLTPTADTDKGLVVVVLDTSKPLGSSLTHGLHWRSRAVFWKQGGRQQSPLWRLQVGHGSSSNSAFRFFAYFQYAIQTLIDERFDSGRTIMWRGRLIDWLSEQAYT